MNSTLENIMNSNQNVAETAAPAASTAFISISKYLEKENLTGKVAHIDYTTDPVYSYTTADGVKKDVRGIVLKDAGKHQLCLMTVSERLAKKSINDVAAIFGTCKVLEDTYQVTDKNGKVTLKTSYKLCSPQEVATAGVDAAVSL